MKLRTHLNCLPWLCALLLCAGGCATVRKGELFTGPWDLKELRQPPAAEWGSRSNLVQEVFYRGEALAGQETRVFAYYARPETGDGPFPAMILVHGGGGKAFGEWAAHWARRGYVALAMDLSGRGPDGMRLPDGGPEQSDQVKFRNFQPEQVRDMWTYHAVAAVIRAHSLLATRPEVDKRRIGITGISWGGYLTCIVVGLDDRFRVAVPVYGCGFLDENSCWLKNFARMDPGARQRWIEWFDPARYLSGVDCPILFLNGSNDFAYPLDSYKKSYSLVHSPRTVSVKIRMRHGHIWTWDEVDLFVDSVLRRGNPLPRLGSLHLSRGMVAAKVSSRVPLAKAELHYTTDTGDWQKRLWQTAPATVGDGTVKAALPPERPIVCSLSVWDTRDVCVSTPHEIFSSD